MSEECFDGRGEGGVGRVRRAGPARVKAHHGLKPQPPLASLIPACTTDIIETVHANVPVNKDYGSP